MKSFLLLIIFTLTLSYCKSDKTPESNSKFDDNFSQLLVMVKDNFGLHRDKEPAELRLNDAELEDLKAAYRQSMLDINKRKMDFQYHRKYGSYNDPVTVTLTHILNRKAGMDWTTFNHTAKPIITYALGVNHQTFNGSYHHIDIHAKIEKAMKRAKYIFLFIGDGMGLNQLSAAEHFISSTASTDNIKNVKKSAISQFPSQGVTRTYSIDSFITDSAAAATSIATGKKTKLGYIGLDSKKEIIPTLAERAKSSGRKVGIISTVPINHATPACFYAHNISRKNYYEIALALTNSSFDYFAGGGIKLSKKNINKLGQIKKLAAIQGFDIIEDSNTFKALKYSNKKIWAMDSKLDPDQAMTYSIDRNINDLSIVDYTEKGIELLDNRKGFFFMIEGGKIDWACHANDAATSIYNTLQFDRAVAKAVEFYNKHPRETLIVVTADHECGGLSLGTAVMEKTTRFDLLMNQKVSYSAFSQMIEKLRNKKNNP